MKPIAPSVLSETHEVKPGDRLHRLISRMVDTYYDDISDDRIEEIERKVDEWRWMHADGSRFHSA